MTGISFDVFLHHKFSPSLDFPTAAREREEKATLLEMMMCCLSCLPTH